MSGIEAFLLLENMIQVTPKKYFDNGAGFLVSKEIANALLNYIRFGGFIHKESFESGEEFQFKGIKCKVA